MKILRRKASALLVNFACVGILSAGPTRTGQPYTYSLQFSTYFGSSGDCRGMDVDAQGNVYLVGATRREGWPATADAYDRTWQGDSEVVVSKWSPEGKLLWSTFIGKTYRAYSIKVDRAGYIYIAGRAGSGFPTTPGSFQPDFKGGPFEKGENGQQNGFVAKLSPEGSRLVWASFVGTGQEVRDMVLDNGGDIYMTLSYDTLSKSTLPTSWFAAALSRTPRGEEDCGVIKISNDGKKVLWATWIGGSEGNAQDNSLCVGADHCPVLFMGTHDSSRHHGGSSDQPTTPGAFQRTPDSAWLGKLSADGSHLIFATFIGDGRAAIPRTHDVALDRQGNIFVGLSITGNWPVTPGAFQAKYGGGKGDWGIAKFSPTGRLLAATYLGGSGDEINGPDGLSVDQHGDVLITGGFDLNSLDYPVTRDCFQPNHGGGSGDGVFSLMSNDLGTLLYSTYMGGSGDDNLRANAFGPHDSIYVAGDSLSPDWPTANAYQSALEDEQGNAFVLAKFMRIRPAPAGHGH